MSRDLGASLVRGQNEFELTDPQSAYTCGHKSDRTQFQTCISTVGSGDTAKFATCEGTTLGSMMFLAMPAVTTTTAFISSVVSGTLTLLTVDVATTGSAFIAYHPLIDLRVRPLDLPQYEDSNATNATAENSSAATAAAENDGLPLEAKIAIGVIVPLLVLAMLAFAMFVLRKRHQQRVSDASSKFPHPHAHAHPQPWSASYSAYPERAYAAGGAYAGQYGQFPRNGNFGSSPLSADSELCGSPVYELHGDVKAQEMGHDQKVRSVASTGRGYRDVNSGVGSGLGWTTTIKRAFL